MKLKMLSSATIDRKLKHQREVLYLLRSKGGPKPRSPQPFLPIRSFTFGSIPIESPVKVSWGMGEAALRGKTRLASSMYPTGEPYRYLALELWKPSNKGMGGGPSELGLRRLHSAATYLRNAKDELFTVTRLKERGIAPELVMVATSAVEREFREINRRTEVGTR